MQKSAIYDLIETGFFEKGRPVYINKIYSLMVPRPTEEQRNGMLESIKLDGLHEDLVINSDNVLLDGHTRLEICRELRIQPRFLVKCFKSVDEERKYVVVTNLKRRHLNDFQVVELTHDLFNKIKEETHNDHLDLISKVKSGQIKPMGSDDKKTSSYRYGKMIGVSRGQVDKSLFILKHGSPLLINKVRLGERTIHSVYEEINGRITVVDKKLEEKKDLLLEKTFVVKSKYRSNLGILYSILDGLSENNNKMIVSKISRACNLSHYAVLEKCAKLEKVGLVRHYLENRNRFYEITGDGLIFKKDFDFFITKLEGFGLDKEL